MSFQSQSPQRSQLDALKQTTIALPIISATANTNAIDLECVNTFPAIEQVSFLANMQTANANSGNAAVISLQIQHSATNVSANFANIPGTGPINIASNGAVYPANTAINFPTPDGCLQFVRLQIIQGAGGANSANAANITFQLGF